MGECKYGDWTGKPLKELAKDPLWPVVQAHPSAVRFPGPGGESMLDMQHRAVAAVREWNARLGKDATYLVCSHGDVIKAIVADALGLHLDQCQRISRRPLLADRDPLHAAAAVPAPAERHRRRRRRPAAAPRAAGQRRSASAVRATPWSAAARERQSPPDGWRAPAPQVAGTAHGAEG